MIPDGSASRHEIPTVELDRDLAGRRHEPPKRQETREGERFEEKPGESETLAESGYERSPRSGQPGDADRERGAAGQQERGRAAAEPAPARPEQAAEPRDRMEAVRRIAESQIDRQGQQQSERLRDVGAQSRGNDSLASLATAATSTARATASASRSYLSPAGVPHRGSTAIPFRSARNSSSARRNESFAKSP